MIDDWWTLECEQQLRPLTVQFTVTFSKSYTKKQKWMFFSEHSVYVIVTEIDALMLLTFI